MKSEGIGKSTSAAEVSHVSSFGIWILIDGQEYFLDYVEYPWFKDARMKEIFHVERIGSDHLQWPDLDIDLHLDCIRHPSRYPLLYH